jgi:peroxidase
MKHAKKQKKMRNHSGAPFKKTSLSGKNGRCLKIHNSGINGVNLFDLLSKEQLITPKEKKREFMNEDDLEEINFANNCVRAQKAPNCEDNACYHLKYRTMDGTCNNMAHPLWGAAYSEVYRYVKPRYDDGIGAPVGYLHNKLPSSRMISRYVLQQSDTKAKMHPTLNAILMQWGQFIAHDMAQTTNIGDGICPNCADSEICYNIPVNESDPNAHVFGCDGQGKNFRCCITHPRTAPICGTGIDKMRTQLNENTGFLDASTVYGSSVPDMQRFRDGETPFLRMQTIDGAQYLPFDDTNDDFLAGDDRVNIFVGLIAMHTLLARQHNRLAKELQTLNPDWSNDQVFEEARKIVGALVQIISYRDWLPNIIGPHGMELLGEYKGYQPEVNPTIAIEFSTGIFRFGHGLILAEYPRINEKGEEIDEGPLLVVDSINEPERIFEGGVSAILRGMSRTASKMPQNIVPDITQEFMDNRDLASINVQRGRDNAIPSYNGMRKFCGLDMAKTLQNMTPDTVSDQARHKFANMYKDNGVDSVDLYPGALMEAPVKGGIIGKTMTCVIVDQLRRLRDGDRFWWDQDSVFTKEQRAELAKISLARIVCDNAEGFTHANKNFFKMKNVVPCNKIPSINLKAWKS